MAGVGAPRPTATRAPAAPGRGRGCRYFPGSGRRRRATASREGDAHDRDVPHRHSHSVVRAHTVTDGHSVAEAVRRDVLRSAHGPAQSRSRVGSVASRPGQCRQCPCPVASGARVSRVMHPRAHVRWYSLALNETQKYLLTHSQLYIHFLGGLDRFLLSNALPVCSWMT